jgi:hypothetical protein
MIRRALGEWLDGPADAVRGKVPLSGKLLDHEDAERRQQANVDALRRSARTRKGRRSGAGALRRE